MSRFDRRRNYEKDMRPELVLRKAKELNENERFEDALDLLKNCINAPRNGKTKFRSWNPNAHPQIMELYVKLGVDLRQSYAIKDGIYSCKSMTQHSFPEELEKIIRYYLKLAKDKVKVAKKMSKDSLQELENVDDLDSVETPEMLLLKSVTSKTAEDRAERAHVMPWFKFLWDAYKHMLDCLSVHNIKLEKMYNEVAHEACKFCVDNNRTTEFRKLGDTLRLHLRQLTETEKKSSSRRENMVTLIYAPSQAVENPTNKAQQVIHSQQVQTEIRHNQLKSAIALKLWQEAHKTIDDIFTLRNFTRRVPKSYPNKPSFQAKFLELMAKVYEKSGQHLLHAATLHRIFTLNKDMKTHTTEKDKFAFKKLASQTLVATLAIPLTEKQPGLTRLIFDLPPANNERYAKWCKILNYERMPLRQQLVQDIQYKGVIQFVPRELQILFNNLEQEFNPLRLSNRVDECLKWLNDNEKNEFSEDLKPYMNQIQHVTASRVISQVSSIYDTIQFSRMQELVPFYNKFQLEQHMLDDCRSGRLRAKIDHANKQIKFGTKFDPTPLCITTQDDLGHIANITNGNVEKDWLNEHLNNIHLSISKAAVAIRTDEDRAAQAIAFQEAAKFFKKNDDATCDKFAKRKLKGEDIKKRIENEEQEAETRKAQEATRKANEAKRKRDEEEQRIRDKLAAERQEIETKENQIAYFTHKLAEMKKEEKALVWCEYIEPEDLMELTTEEVAEKQVEGLRKAKLDSKRALCKREDDKDYLERAKRMVEKQLKESTAEQRAATEAADYENWKQETLRKSKETFELDQKFKTKFASYGEKIDESCAEAEEKAQGKFEKELDAWEDMKAHTIAEQKQAHRDQHVALALSKFDEKVKRMQAIVASFQTAIKRAEREAKTKALQERNPETIRRTAPVEPIVDRQQSVDGPRRPRRFIGAAKVDNNAPLRQNSGGEGFARKTDDRPSQRPPSTERDLGSLRREDGPPRRFGGDRNPSKERDFGDLRRRDDDPSARRFDDGPRRMNDGPRRMDDGPRRMDDGPRRMDDGPRRMDDGPRRNDDGPRRDGPPRRFIGRGQAPGGPRNRSNEREEIRRDGPVRERPGSSPSRGGWRSDRKPSNDPAPTRPETGAGKGDSSEVRRPRRFIGKKQAEALPADQAQEQAAPVQKVAEKSRTEEADDGWTVV